MSPSVKGLGTVNSLRYVDQSCFDTVKVSLREFSYELKDMRVVDDTIRVFSIEF